MIAANISIAGLGVSIRAGDADADDRVDVTVAVTFGEHETTQLWSKTFESQDKNEVVGHVRRALEIAAKLF